jgi:CheY-like chemotaxis protein
VKVLFLDDDERRCKLARRMYAKDDLTVVHSAVDAINQLGFQSFDLVSLDHDLGGEVYVDSNREDCGMEVVRWICTNKPTLGMVNVHTWNIPAALEMGAKLEDADYRVVAVPFGAENIWLAEPRP